MVSDGLPWKCTIIEDINICCTQGSFTFYKSDLCKYVYFDYQLSVDEDAELLTINLVLSDIKY